MNINKFEHERNDLVNTLENFKKNAEYREKDLIEIDKVILFLKRFTYNNREEMKKALSYFIVDSSNIPSELGEIVLKFNQK
jgi:hypothetical protein